jgi:hypothetical protein
MKKILLLTIVASGMYGTSPAHTTTYLDTRNLFAAVSTPAQDLNIVNPTDGGTAQDSSIGLGTLSADIPVQNDYYLNFSAPFPNACVTIINNLQPSGTSFFNIAYFTSDGGGFLGHDDVVGNDIKTLSDGTCAAHFRAIDARSAGNFAVLQVRHFSGGYLIPSFPLVMTSGGTWTGPLAPYCGLHCRHYNGTLYAQLSDNPFTVPSITVPSLSGLQEYKSDAMTPIIEGQTTTEDVVVFGGVLQSFSGNPLRLEVEVRPFAMAFTNNVTATSPQAESGQTAFAVASSLPDGLYHWRARAVDIATGFASQWQEFGTVEQFDFKIHQVPLVDQTNPRWNVQPYANGRGNNLNDSGRCGPNIGNCGCAITSAVMVLQYYGIAAATDDQPVDPLHLDAWLDGNNGYDEFGNLNWLKIQEYSQTTPTGLARVHYEGGYTNDPRLLDTYLNAMTPAILRVQVPTKSGGLASHYVVAASKLLTTYAIRDPLFVNTKTLNNPAEDGTNRVRDYNNEFAGLRIYSDFSGPTDGVVFTIASPAQLLVADPAGKRLGIDPTSNISYAEIAGGTYFIDGISDISNENTAPAHEVKTIYIPHPMPGNYSVQVIGTALGTYSFSSLAYDANGTPHSQVFDGITQKNLITPYNLNFIPEQPSGIVTSSRIMFGGFLPPIKIDGSGSYHQGRSLPVKFQLTDENGELLTNRTAQLFVAKVVNNAAGSDNVPFPAAGASGKNTFRLEGHHYAFNLDTTPLDPGLWQLKVALDDGSSHTVIISIKP